MHSARTARPKPFRRTTPTADERNPIGRPSLYRQEYCEQVVTAMYDEGISLFAFAGLIGVDKDSVYEWIKVHPEFSAAVKRAHAARLLFLERRLLNSNGKDTIGSIFALKNAAPDQWQDRRYVEQHHTVKADLLTTDELRAIAAGHDPLMIDVTPDATPDATPVDDDIDLPNVLHDKQSQED